MQSIVRSHTPYKAQKWRVNLRILAGIVMFAAVAHSYIENFLRIRGVSSSKLRYGTLSLIAACVLCTVLYFADLVVRKGNSTESVATQRRCVSLFKLCLSVSLLIMYVRVAIGSVSVSMKMFVAAYMPFLFLMLIVLVISELVDRDVSNESVSSLVSGFMVFCAGIFILLSVLFGFLERSQWVLNIHSTFLCSMLGMASSIAAVVACVAMVVACVIKFVEINFCSEARNALGEEGELSYCDIDPLIGSPCEPPPSYQPPPESEPPPSYECVMRSYDSYSQLASAPSLSCHDEGVRR